MSGFLSSGQLITGSTSLIYKGNDGTSRILNPASYQPAGSYAAASHNHSASAITSGTLAVARGGTGQTSVDTTPTSGSKKMCTSGGIYTAINDLKTSVSNGKSAVASAITDKGVSTSATASFDTMASNIRSIETISGSLINLPNGYLYSTSTFVHGFSMSWFNEAHGNSTLTYPISSNYVSVTFGSGSTIYTNLINWTSGKGSNTYVNSYYQMYNNGSGNYFSGINLKGYKTINIKFTENNNGSVYMFIIQLLSTGVLQLYRYTITASSSTSYIGTASLGFTGNSSPYAIICGATNGYYHTIQFT